MAGRPPIEVTPDHLRQIEVLAGYGMTEASIAWVIGMCPDTFRVKKSKDERIPRALEKGKAGAETKIGEALYTKAINGDLGAIVWWEKTRANRYERSRHELTHRPRRLDGTGISGRGPTNWHRTGTGSSG